MDVHRHARHMFTSLFGPDGLQSFVPRMEKMVRDHFVKFWEGKDEIMVFAIVEQFTCALPADLFFSITEGPQFWSLEHDLFTLSQGIGLPPIDFPGTSYHNAKVSCDRILSTLDTITCQRCKVNEKLFKIISFFRRCFLGSCVRFKYLDFLGSRMRFKYLDFLGVMMNFIGAHGCLELLLCLVFCILCCSVG